MHQLQLDCTSEASLKAELDKLEDQFFGNQQHATLFHVFNATADPHAADSICDLLHERFPAIPYACASANANLVNGAYVREKNTVSVTCSVFEDPGTRVEVAQFPLDYETQDATAQALLDLVEANPWVKAVEMLSTINDVNMADFCKRLNDMPSHIACVGGGALDSTTDFGRAAVQSSVGNVSHHGVVFVLYGGENFHIRTVAIHGWRPLGMPFLITRAEKSTIYELNGRPAYEVYNHYLSIPEEDDFSWNGLLFPIAIDHDGVSILRTPVSANPDGSIVLPTDISNEHHECRIAYGDPATILRRVGQIANELQAFKPQGILCFSCAARLVYWGRDYIDRETQPFQAIAPTAGFFTGSEFIRQEGNVLQHNVTLVLAAVREGDNEDVDPSQDSAPIEVDDREFNLQLAIINRMASFIGAASDELQDAYDSMELMARTDGLTGLADRRETERLISSALHNSPLPKVVQPISPANSQGEPALIMLDLDNFKRVNDTFGHEVGDDVLRKLAKLLHHFESSCGTDLFAGRWGGEEFMVMLPYASLDEAVAIAEKLCTEFASLDIPEVGHCTMSLGVAKAKPGEPLSGLCSRADTALYEAKMAGKNRVAVSEPPANQQ